MSKLAHSNTKIMDAIEFWRAYEEGALEPMDSAPRDGREIFVAFPDDQAPNQNKARMLVVRAGGSPGGWKVQRGMFRGDVFFNNHFEGWIEPCQ